MRRAIKYEIRLAYYDRIAKTLPEPMQAPEGYTLPKEAPGPVFAYEDPSKCACLSVVLRYSTLS